MAQPRNISGLTPMRTIALAGCAIALSASLVVVAVADPAEIDAATTASADTSSAGTNPLSEPTTHEDAHAEAPHADTPADRRLDFWLGEWDVYSPSGELLGRSTVTASLDGKVIYERWESVNGVGRGESMNYLDPSAHVWKQVWVDAAGNVIEIGGDFTEGAMRFEGRNLRRDGRTRGTRVVLKPTDAGRLHQTIAFADEAGAWTTAFEGIAVPAGEPFKPAAHVEPTPAEQDDTNDE